MTLPLSPLTAAAATPRTTAESQNDAALKQAAQEFEAILLREMLKSVEKCAKLGSGGENSGQSVYGSMIVDAVAQAVSQAGGLGLTQTITTAWRSADRATPALPTHPADGKRET